MALTRTKEEFEGAKKELAALKDKVGAKNITE